MIPVHFNGVGLLTALGEGVDANLKNLASASDHLSSMEVNLSDEDMAVPYFLVSEPGRDAGANRLMQIIDRVVADAINDAELSPEQVKRAGVFVGSTSFDIFYSEESIRSAEQVTDEVIASSLTRFGRLASYIRAKFEITGPEYTFSTACTASANAVMYAAEMIRSGDIEHALVVGLEFSNDVTLTGFHSLDLISQQGMRPFNRERDGLLLGEGCGAIVMSREQTKDHGFYYLGGANIGDTYSITASDPDGESITEVMSQAVGRAGCDKSDIKVVKAHGTASLSNDEAEASGLRRYFGEGAMPPIQVYKPLIGHTLGACGINELILFFQSVNQGLSSPYCRSDEIDADLGVQLWVAEEGTCKGHYLLNYFGFGGNNTSLVIANQSAT